jgi:hypothetical protein
MIERVEVDGRQGFATWIDDKFVPVEKDVATLIKIVFDDGGQLILSGSPSPQAQERKRWADKARRQTRLKFDPSEPRDPAGKWTDGGGDGGGVNAYSVSENAGIDAHTIGPAEVAAAEKAAKEGAAAGAARALAAGVKPLAGSSGHPAIISPRRITSKRATPEQLRTYAQPSTAAMKIETKPGESVFHDNVSLLRNEAFYPNMRAEDLKGTDDQIARRFIDHAKANMRFLYELMPPKEREENRIWYDGARVIVDSRAQHYGMNDAAVAAVYAALSPQMLWDVNVTLGDQMIDAWSKHQDTAWDQKMTDARSLWSKVNQKLFDQVAGKKLNELTDAKLKAVWMRTYIQTHYDQTYRYVLANGQFDSNARNKQTKKEESEGKQGKLSGVRPQTLPAYTAAVKALESNGDPVKISQALSDTHKVRSFYNNILDPHSANGDVTIDTHQVGSALLRPLGGSTAPVLQNFELGPDKADQAKMAGEWQASRGSAVTGSHGTYGFYADATRELAKELGLQPRQLQSIVWVMKRKLMPDTITDKQSNDMEQAWKDYHDGKLDLGATQKMVAKIGGYGG